MMKVEIKTGNAAFRDEEGNEDIYSENREIARLLHTLAGEILHSESSCGSLNDINGNKVLTWKRN